VGLAVDENFQDQTTKESMVVVGEAIF